MVTPPPQSLASHPLWVKTYPLHSHLNGSTNVELSGQRTTSDRGVQALPEALDRSSVTPMTEGNMLDLQRTAQNKQDSIIVDRFVGACVEYSLWSRPTLHPDLSP